LRDWEKKKNSRLRERKMFAEVLDAGRVPHLSIGTARRWGGGGTKGRELCKTTHKNSSTTREAVILTVTLIKGGIGEEKRGADRWEVGLRDGSWGKRKLLVERAKAGEAQGLKGKREKGSDNFCTLFSNQRPKVHRS